MYACKDCGLAFEQVDNNGRCEGCAAAQTQQQATNNTGESELDKIRREQQAMNQRLSTLASSMQQPPAQQQQQMDPADATKQFYSNPIAASDYIATQRAQQVAQQMMSVDHETMVAVAKREAREAAPEVWEKYGSEIEARAAQNPPVYHRNVGMWKNIATMVAGEHYRELARDQREAAEEGKTKAPAVRTGGPAAPSTRPAPSLQREEELSPLAKEVAKKMRLSDSRMREAIKNYANQGDERDPSVPSSWDAVMTFGPGTGRYRTQEQGAK